MAGCGVGPGAMLPSPPPAQEHRGLLALRYPMEHGVVRDWNDMERIWQYVYSKDQLQTFSEEVRGQASPGSASPRCAPPAVLPPGQAPTFPAFAGACCLFTVGTQQSGGQAETSHGESACDR